MTCPHTISYIYMILNLCNKLSKFATCQNVTKYIILSMVVAKAHHESNQPNNH